MSTSCQSVASRIPETSWRRCCSRRSASAIGSVNRTTTPLTTSQVILRPTTTRFPTPAANVSIVPSWGPPVTRARMPAAVNSERHAMLLPLIAAGAATGTTATAGGGLAAACGAFTTTCAGGGAWAAAWLTCARCIAARLGLRSARPCGITCAWSDGRGGAATRLAPQAGCAALAARATVGLRDRDGATGNFVGGGANCEALRCAGFWGCAVFGDGFAAIRGGKWFFNGHSLAGCAISISLYSRRFGECQTIS
jgi:hypothetical protein